MAVTHERVHMTPEMGRQLLAKYKNIREIQPDKVEQYTRIILAKQWLEVGAITFDENGNLINGFHRLHAIVMANVPVWLWIERGVPAQSVMVIDTGVIRRPMDMIRAMGEKDRPRVRAALLRAFHDVMRELAPGQKPTTADTQYLYGLYRRGIDFTIACFPANRAKICNTGIIVAWGKAYLMLPDRGDDLMIAARKFFDCKFGPKDEALRLLYRFVASSKTRPQKDAYLRTANALQQWLNGENPTRLMPASEDPFPLPKRIVNKVTALGLAYPAANLRDHQEPLPFK